MRRYSLILAVCCASMTVVNICDKDFRGAIYYLVLTFLNHVAYNVYTSKLKKLEERKDE